MISADNISRYLPATAPVFNVLICTTPSYLLSSRILRLFKFAPFLCPAQLPLFFSPKNIATLSATSNLVAQAIAPILEHVLYGDNPTRNQSFRAYVFSHILAVPIVTAIASQYGLSSTHVSKAALTVLNVAAATLGLEVAHWLNPEFTPH